MPDLPTLLQTSLPPPLPRPSQAWLTTLINSRTPPPPLPSLTATARTRLLAADLTTPNLLDPAYIASHSLPSNLSDATVRQITLSHDICVQVLDMENLSKSRWSQVEELEALERGEGSKGREMVRLREEGEEQGERGMTQAQTQSTQGAGRAAATAGAGSEKATHKLVLQDAKGQKIYGLELKKVDKIAIGKLNIGEKIMIKGGASVSRGVIMLEPSTCVVLGGKVDAWHKAWVEGRLARLKETTAANRQ